MDHDWRDRFILTPAISIPGERAALYRGAARGEFVRVIRGAYLRSDDWESLGFEGRHLARIRAARLLDPDLVFSHLSAAMLWGLPIIGGDLTVPHALGEIRSGSRSRTWLRRHELSRPRAVAWVDGIPVTTLLDTLVDVAAAYDPELSVPVLDAALARTEVTRAALVEGLALVPTSGGAVRGRWAVGFADGRSGSPGESLSRVGIHRLRLPRPELQIEVMDAHGLAGIVDFWWPDVRLVGEFDGVGKYLREEFTDGRDLGEIVMAEKRREDRIRATDRRVARWGWDAARSAPMLRRILSEAGLRAA